MEHGSLPLVGVNCHRMPREEHDLLRDVAETRIEPDRATIEDVAAWKRRRNLRHVRAALTRLESDALDKNANIVEAIVGAMRADVTMGEAVGVLRETYGAKYDPLAGSERP